MVSMRGLLLLLAACVGHAPPPTISSSSPSTPSRAAGSFEGRPFVARSALMLSMNRVGRNCAYPGDCSIPDGFTSVIRIYDRAVTCADVVETARSDVFEAPLGIDWDTLIIHIEGMWPPPEDTLHTTDWDPRPSDHVFAMYEQGQHKGRAIDGAMRILAATERGGTIRFDLVRRHGSDRDTFIGTVDFTACRPGV